VVLEITMPIPVLNTTDVTIANGATLSTAADLSNGQTLAGLILPAALTSTAITFTMCDTSAGTFVPVYAAGGAAVYSLTVGAARYVPVDRDAFAGAKFVKVVGGSSEGGARTIRLSLRAKG
jgi:hypothetical protein